MFKLSIQRGIFSLHSEGNDKMTSYLRKCSHYSSWCGASKLSLHGWWRPARPFGSASLSAAPASLLPILGLLPYELLLDASAHQPHPFLPPSVYNHHVQAPQASSEPEGLDSPAFFVELALGVDEQHWWRWRRCRCRPNTCESVNETPAAASRIRTNHVASGNCLISSSVIIIVFAPSLPASLDAPARQ